MPSGCALILTSFISTTTSDSAGTETRIASHIGGQSRRQTRSPGVAARCDSWLNGTAVRR